MGAVPYVSTFRAEMRRRPARMEVKAWGNGGVGWGCCPCPMVYAPSTTLLNLGHVELEEAVEPRDEFLAARLRRWSVSTSTSTAQSKGGGNTPLRWQSRAEGEEEGPFMLTVIHPSCCGCT